MKRMKRPRLFALSLDLGHGFSRFVMSTILWDVLWRQASKEESDGKDSKDGKEHKEHKEQRWIQREDVAAGPEILVIPVRFLAFIRVFDLTNICSNISPTSCHSMFPHVPGVLMDVP